MAFVDRTEELFARSRGQCEYVKTHQRARELLASARVAALDFETTSLSPLDGDIRLTSVCNDEVHFIIDHFFLEHFEEYIDLIADPDKIWWVFNAKFETTWIDYYDESESAVIYDVDFAKKAKMGGMPNKLAWMAKDVGVIMSKDEQASNWNTPQLSQNQLDYAGFDSFVTWELKKHWWDNELNDAHRKGFHVFNDAVRATAECERTGLVLDAQYHVTLVDNWKLKHATFERYLRKWTPPEVIKNLRSNPQVGRFLERELPKPLLDVWPRTDKKEELQLEGKYLRSVSRRVSYPMSRWLAALAGFKYYGKYLDTYGDTLLTIQRNQGKITSRFNIGQAATGRYSSSSSNLQNIPRKPIVRRSFSIAKPTTSKTIPDNSPLMGNRLMCLADYSGIEVRVLAELSGDETLIHDAIYGDVHSASACQIYGIDQEEFAEGLKSSDGRYKEMRSTAKGFTFQLTYGAGPAALSDVLRCTFDQAIEAIEKWADRYKKAYAYRDKMFDEMNATGFLPVCDGRTIYVFKSDRSMPVAANYPIQGAAASVMYRAMYRTRERVLDAGLDAYLAATVHDELLMYAHKYHAEQAMAQQIAGMTEGWLDIFPNTSTDNLIEYKVGTSWKDKP
jgi:DNA polymerase-1